MTDLEKFVDLYKSFGIDCKSFTKTHTDNRLYNWIEMGRDGYYYIDEKIFTLSDKFNNSYNGFYTAVIFDSEGKFVEQRFLE